ncbi:hypothetical protein IKE13_02580 [Candidatus Saccharibacteria bacterium]|nr:hypothetical protein [Candidatus Saccharibacteria bacterium]MBR2803004.1 hypothetical protein [Candidatus Saccharibacteria bacterium]
MRSFVRNDNKVLVVVLCALTVVMIGLIVGITVVKVNRYNESISGGQSDGSGGQGDGYMAGTTKPMGLDDEGDENDDEGEGGSEQGGESETENAERVQRWFDEAEDVRNGFDGMTLEDALAYIEQRAEEKDDLDDAFNIRIIKVNVLYYYEMYDEALAELNRVEHPEDLALWNQEEYYNMLYLTSIALGDEEAAEGYAELWREANYKRTGGPKGVED